jgi:hypothetical protein
LFLEQTMSDTRQEYEIASEPPADADTLPVGGKRQPPPEGWLCPRCKRVNAPWVERCECEPEKALASVGPSEFK